MYFPKGFDSELSIELGELTRQAYAQFDAFENEESWSLPEKYRLIAELAYTWKPESPIGKSIGNFDVALRRLSRMKAKEAVRIPIGFIARSQKSSYLIVRGTQTTKEWVGNLNIDLAPYPLPNGGKVHEGFMRIYASIRDGIMESLSAVNGKVGLYVAGHSLGAALATLAAPDIESTTACRVAALYTFGSPRVGDDAFVRAFNARFHDRSFRVVNTADIVTSVPLPVPIAGIAGGYFTHVDTPVDMTVQRNDIKENHVMETYLSELGKCRVSKGFFGNLFQRAPDRA